MERNELKLSCEIDLVPGESLALPQSLPESMGPGRWRVIVQPIPPARHRGHGAFLQSFVPEDEGLYDDAAPR